MSVASAIVILSLMACSFVPKPMELNTTVVAEAGALSVKEPSPPVVAPTDVPLMSTVTPGRPSPDVWSVTRPVMVRSWAAACKTAQSRARHTRKNLLIV